jgi:hypothetical protein
MDNCHHSVYSLGPRISDFIYALGIYSHIVGIGYRGRDHGHHPGPAAGGLKMRNSDPKLPPPDPDPQEPGPAPVPIREPENPDPDVIDPNPVPLPA